MSHRDRRDSYGGSRDRHDNRRSGASSSSRRSPSPSPPPKPRSDKELPESFGRIPDLTKDDDSNVLQRMKTKFDKVPLGSLAKCLETNRKIKVWTRNFKEVRGICTGYVVAFDKHWNLVMADVDEVYLKRKKYKTPFFDDIQTAEKFAELPKRTPKGKKDPISVETQENQPAPVEAEETAMSTGETAESTGETAESTGETAESTGETAEGTGETAESAGETTMITEKTAPNAGETAPKTGEKKKKRQRKKKGSAPQKRHVKQLFIRGDSIVMAAILEIEENEETES